MESQRISIKGALQKIRHLAEALRDEKFEGPRRGGRYKDAEFCRSTDFGVMVRSAGAFAWKGARVTLGQKLGRNMYAPGFKLNRLGSRRAGRSLEGSCVMRFMF